MPLRLLPLAPECATAMQFDAGDPADSGVELHATVERPRRLAVDIEGQPPPSLQVVGGVRRAEARALDNGPDREPMFALLGSARTGEWVRGNLEFVDGTNVDRSALSSPPLRPGAARGSDRA